MKRKIIDFFAGRIGLQPLFEWLYTAGVYGMNYSNGGNFRHSGELSAARHIRSTLVQLKQPIVLFDVGANQGFYALELSKVFKGTDFKLYAFEPSKEIYHVMQKAVAEEKHIIPFNTGFGEQDETKTLYKRSALSGLSSLYQRRLDHFGIHMSIQEQIRIGRIDDFCKEHSINRIHFLKLDIEGHELSCLLGASNMLKDRKIDFIQFEFGGCNIDSRTYFQDFWYLLKEEYDLYRIVKNGMVPIRKYNERLEIFKNINFLAVLKKND